MRAYGTDDRFRTLVKLDERIKGYPDPTYVYYENLTRGEAEKTEYNDGARA